MYRNLDASSQFIKMQIDIFYKLCLNECEHGDSNPVKVEFLNVNYVVY